MLHILAITRLCILILYTIFTVCTLLILNATCPYHVHRKFLNMWYRFCLWLLGFHVTVTGPKPLRNGMLIISNHCSYMDILVIGSLFPVHFTPKSTIKNWPFIAQMVGVNQPIYIDRQDRRAMHLQNKRIAAHIKAGKNVVLYPEGTTSNGCQVYPFKTGFFAFLEDPELGQHLPVLPVTIVYTATDNLPLTQGTPSPIAWYGDDSLVPHLWRLLRIRKTQVQVMLHPTLTIEHFSSRKELAAYCEDIIRKDLAATLNPNV